MKKFFKKINIKNIYLICSTIILLVIFLLQFFNIYAIITGILLLLLIFWISKFNIPKFPLFLFIAMLIIRIIAIYIFPTPPVSDFAAIYNAAKNLLNKVNVLNESAYFIKWAYQTGPVLYTYVLLSIYNSVNFVKIVNCIFSSINCILIYSIAKKFVSERSAKLSSLLYGLTSFSILYNSILANQIPGSTFFYLALLILLNNEHSIKNYIICAILLSIGNFLRTEGIIFICAIIGLYIFYLISKKSSKQMNIGIILLVVLYFSLNFSYGFLIKTTGINNNGLQNSMTSWKLILGLNTSTCGQYNNDDIIYLKNKKIANKEVINRFKNLAPRSSLELVSCKAQNLWSGGTLFWTFNGLENKTYNILGFNFNMDNIKDILTSKNKMFYYIAFILMIYGLFKYYKSNKFNYKVLLFVNILVINFIVYSLIEVQPRYIYLLEISIYILSSLGFEYLLKNKKDC